MGPKKKGASRHEDAEDLDSAPAPQVMQGKKGKKGKKGRDDFDDDFKVDLEEPLNDGVEDAAPTVTTDSQPLGKKGKKGKGRKGQDDFDEDFKVDPEEPLIDGVEDAASTVTADSQPGGKKGKKGKGKKGRDGFDDDFKVDLEEPLTGGVEDAATTVTTDSQSGGKKGKKGKGRKGHDDFDDDFTVDLNGDESLAPVSEVGSKKGKKGKKVADEDWNAILAQLEDTEEPAAAEPAPVADVGSKKGKKGKKVADESWDAILAELEAPEEPAAAEGGKKKKKGKTKKEEEDIDALLAELEAPAPEEEAAVEEVEKAAEEQAERAEGEDKEEVELSAAAKKKKKRKTKKEEEDIDALLAELDGPTITSKDEEAAPKEVENAAEEQAEEAAEGDEKEGVELSAAAKKKKKKKEKEKAKAAEKAPDKEEEVAEKEEAPKKGKKGPPVPKHVREMQERLARIQAEEEKRKKEEEERIRKEQEEAERLAEEERKKEEAKRLKKEREKEKLRQAKLAGKPVTAKQKEEARRMQLMRERLLQQGVAVGDGGDGGEGADSAPKKLKVVYDTKKKRGGPRGAQQGEESAPTPTAAAESKAKEEAEAAAVAAAVEAAAKQAAEEVAKQEKAAAEAAAAEEVAAKEVQKEESESEEDWDAKDWDAEDLDKSLAKKKIDEEEEEEVEQAAPKGVAKAAVKSSSPAPKVTAKPAAKAAPPKGPPSRTAKAPPRKAAPLSESETESESEEESESGSEESDDEEATRKRAAAEKRKQRMAEAMKNRKEDDLRSPICCILGHVDTGKTKLLDRIRNTNVQEGEAGGITQQIGATYFPMDAIRERTKELKADATLKVPGLLIIDTPGHESFTNLRSRGSGLCDIAILVVDVMHGLEPQTIESLNLLKLRKTPFIIALNKVDRLYSWKAHDNAPIVASLKKQEDFVRQEFERRVSEAKAQLMEQGLNTELYWKNKDLRKTVNIVPTSAITGEGIPDLLLLLVQLTQKMMSEKLMYLSEVQCTVLEVKVIEGLGTTIDVVLVNGVLRESDTIVVCGLQGPIKTSIRALLTPHPMKELRVKGSYQHHKELKAAQGIKITAQGLESAVAGTQLYVVGPDDDPDDIMEEAMQDMNSILSRVDKSGEGVCVQASTLGSLEALLEFLKSPDVNIPVSGINIGPVHKKDVMRASVMLERKRKEFAAILAFDVKVTTEARELAEDAGVKIFTADIIYHLFDQFTAYMANIKEEKRKESAEEAVFPCTLKILPNCIFNKKDPIVLGVEITGGIAKIGTPVCIPSQGFIDIGRISSMEINHKVVDTAKKGQSVAMKIQSGNAEEAQKMYGRHFDLNDELVSRISRKSIDLLKENYKDDLAKEDWILVVKLKKVFEIQ